MTVATLPWASTLFPGSWEAQARLSPFRGEELWERALPFSVISVLAEASILLPPGPQSTSGRGSESRAAARGRRGIRAALGVPANLVISARSHHLHRFDARPRACHEVGGIAPRTGAPRPRRLDGVFHRRWESTWVVCAVVALRSSCPSSLWLHRAASSSEGSFCGQRLER